MRDWKDAPDVVRMERNGWRAMATERRPDGAPTVSAWRAASGNEEYVAGWREGFRSRLAGESYRTDAALERRSSVYQYGYSDGRCEAAYLEWLRSRRDR